jgi:hypothetical protein
MSAEIERPELTLSKAERESPLWQKLERYVLARIEMARRMNDADLNEIETAKLRGRLSELKVLLAHADPGSSDEGEEAANGSW